jgi:hypothetical protein
MNRDGEPTARTARLGLFPILHVYARDGLDRRHGKDRETPRMRCMRCKARPSRPAEPEPAPAAAPVASRVWHVPALGKLEPELLVAH